MARRSPKFRRADHAAALDLLTQLVAIRGGSGREADVAEFIQKILRGAGVRDDAFRFDDAHRRSGRGEIGNFSVTLPGTIPGPRRLLMAHLDTVPLCLGCDPIRIGRRLESRDRTTGLGGDDRAGVAVVVITALNLLARNLPHPPLTLFFPVQEEVGLVGSRNLDVELLGQPSLAFNWDGGDPGQLTIGATGADAIRIRVFGRASHAGVHPERGVSAVAIAATAIAELHAKGWHGAISKGRQSGTSNFGSISGGGATNVVTAELEITAEARSHDPQFRTKILSEIEGAFERAAAKLKNTMGQVGSIEFQAEMRYEAFRLDEGEPVVQAAAEAVRESGLQPAFHVSNGGLDANWMTAHGIPTVTLGCGQHEIHTVNEWLNLDEFYAACEVALRLATANRP